MIFFEFSEPPPSVDQKWCAYKVLWSKSAAQNGVPISRVSSNGFGRKIGKIFLLCKIFETLAPSVIGDGLSDNLLFFLFATRWRHKLEKNWFSTLQRPATSDIFTPLESSRQIASDCVNKNFAKCCQSCQIGDFPIWWLIGKNEKYRLLRSYRSYVVCKWP